MALFQPFRLLFVLGILLLGCATAQDTCFSDTNVVFEYLTEVADGSQEISVVLCPGTFLIGNLDEDPSGVVDGLMPLIAFPRVRYLCGEDGASTNNCVLKGGQIQFWSPNGAAIETSVYGVTFEDATYIAILLQGSGQVSFVDCIVRDHVQAAPVMVDFSPIRRRRNLADTRELQDATQNVLFDGCSFLNNQQRQPPARFSYGVITVTTEFNTLLVEDCKFIDNVYEEDFGPRSYVIRSFGSPVNVTNSDFCGNSVLGFGLVELFLFDNAVAFGNGGTVQDSLTCPFFALSETIPELDSQVTCLPFERDGCLNYGMPLTSTPTWQPTVVPPSPLPSHAPTWKKTKLSHHGMKMKMMGMHGKGFLSKSESYSSKSKASKASKNEHSGMKMMHHKHSKSSR